MHNIAYVTTNMSTSLTYWDPYWDVQGITARYASQGRLLGLLLRLLLDTNKFDSISFATDKWVNCLIQRNDEHALTPRMAYQ